MIDSFVPVDPALVDVILPEDEQGYPEHLAAEDREPGVLWDCCGSASRKMPKSLMVDPDDWAGQARQNDKNFTWGTNFVDRFTMQDPTHECTNHSGSQNASACRNRHRSIIFKDGPKKEYQYEESKTSGSVFFSCMFPYNKANPNIRGGANVRQILELACAEGFMPDKLQPRDYSFKHTMPGTMGRGNLNQSHGDWVAYKNMPEGWRETAKWFKPLEIVFPESFEEAVSLVLNGYLVSVGRNGHAVPWSRLTFDGDELTGAAYNDSYNVVRYDSVRTMKSAWRGSFAIITMTQPDDWNKPAG